MSNQQAEVRNGYALIEISKIKPSPWNPNRMDGKKFAEYVAEVKHLGRLPKPTVVRPNCEGFEIIDGEHGWRAAQEIGLKEIDCEIVSADDFEAMRQTYKRNQSGKHNKVLQGRMFRQMLEARDLSQRQLAKEIQVSEGTVRNSLLYAEAVERREVYLVEKAERRKALGYKTRKNPPTAEEELEKLTARQVRCFMKLPSMLGNMWLDSGSELRTFFAISSDERIKGDQLDAKLKHPIHDNFVFEYAEAIEESGLLQYADPVHSNGKFVAELKGVRERMDYRDKWRAVVSDHEELDRFLKPHFEDNFFVDSTWSMDEIFEKIVDLDGSFLITSEEFEECLRQQDQQSQSRRYQFEQRIELLVIQKHGALPANNSNVERQLEQLEFEKNAPDFIKTCDWESAAAKQKLFEKYQDADEETRQAIEYAAQLEEPPSVTPRIKQIKRKLAERAELENLANQATCQELADAIIKNMFRGRLEQAEDMKQKLATFSKRDLAVLHCIVSKIAGLQNLERSMCRMFGTWDSLNESEFDWLNHVIAEEGSEASE